ncbi:MAG: hypothetical protein LBS99_06810 [Clostridiales bacterium]|jgi:GNAT superfamily N-acetyltransferase|nr:hypothetical protein [Clostridiales bacterium]
MALNNKPVEIREVKTKKELRDFVNITDKIYKGSPYYVPSFKADDRSAFDPKKNLRLKTCKYLTLVAYRGNKPVGRIAGLIQELAKEKTGEQQARFSYFDVLEDFEAAEALFKRIEKWALQNGSAAVHGPLGFNDMDREGMLVEGFDSTGTFSSLYNHPYYPEFMERMGYVKDVDWLQFRVTIPDYDSQLFSLLTRVGNKALESNNLHIPSIKSQKELLTKYAMPIFNVINITYADLYGTVHITDEVARQVIKDYKMVLSPEFIKIALDKDDNVVAFVLTFPSLSGAIQKSKGRLTPLGILRLMNAVKNYHNVDLGIIGVLPEYRDKGVTAALMVAMAPSFGKHNVKVVETNLELETNIKIHSLWRHFDKVNHKRNRSYIKKL